MDVIPVEQTNIAMLIRLVQMMLHIIQEQNAEIQALRRQTQRLATLVKNKFVNDLNDELMWKNGELAIDNDDLKKKLALAEEPERVSSTRTKVASLCLLTHEIRARLDTGSKAVEEGSQTADTLLHSLKDTY
ncbi:hypothetical protein FBULB1_4021 [Fusarium bulbicola]|nr:hypothetical protein FBULB1_4021 [Fusarium bulbicola]